MLNPGRQSSNSLNDTCLEAPLCECPQPEGAPALPSPVVSLQCPKRLWFCSLDEHLWVSHRAMGRPPCSCHPIELAIKRQHCKQPCAAWFPEGGGWATGAVLSQQGNWLSPGDACLPLEASCQWHNLGAQVRLSCVSVSWDEHDP